MVKSQNYNIVRWIKRGELFTISTKMSIEKINRVINIDFNIFHMKFIKGRLLNVCHS